METEYTLQLAALSPSAVTALFGEEVPAGGTTVTLAAGVTVVVRGTSVRRGIVDSAILVDFVLKVATGVSVKLISDLIAERLRDKKATIKIATRNINVAESAAIAAALASDPTRNGD